MLFTRVGRVVAYFALAVGILTAVTGLFIALGFIGPNDAALARYFPRAGSTGAVIDRGLYTALFGIALGILTEISFGSNR